MTNYIHKWHACISYVLKIITEHHHYQVNYHHYQVNYIFFQNTVNEELFIDNRIQVKHVTSTSQSRTWFNDYICFSVVLMLTYWSTGNSGWLPLKNIWGVDSVGVVLLGVYRENKRLVIKQKVGYKACRHYNYRQLTKKEICNVPGLF